jgi:hypothetical protein
MIFNFNFSRLQIAQEQDLNAPIVTQQLQHYGEEIMMVNQFVMHVVFITNYTM